MATTWLNNFSKSKAPKWILIILALLIGLYLLEVTQAPDKILDDVVVFDEGNHYVLQVKFATAVRYENHFPQVIGRDASSDFLQIKIRTVSLSGADKNEYMSSDSILPGFLEKVPVAELAYEGSVINGPFLSLRFSQPIAFKVAEDPGLHGINIIVPKST